MNRAIRAIGGGRRRILFLLTLGWLSGCASATSDARVNDGGDGLGDMGDMYLSVDGAKPTDLSVAADDLLVATDDLSVAADDLSVAADLSMVDAPADLTAVDFLLPFDGGLGQFIDGSEGCVLTAPPACPGSLELLRNPNFEDVPDGGADGGTLGQGFMPSEWDTPAVGSDTYSNDGSYGLAPADYGNFPGVTAYSGIRWVAGWSAVPEDFWQTLTTPLTPGNVYRIGAALHVSFQHTSAGAYTVFLRNSQVSPTPESDSVVGTFCVTSGSAWGLRSFKFTAPPQAATLDMIGFRPVAVQGGGSYPGFDLVSLTDVTGCP